jgi:hypothetical protein
MTESAHAQVWVSSGFKPGSDAQHETAYCSTSAIDPKTGQVSPAATDYPWFVASCSVTSSTGTTFTNSSPSCINPWILSNGTFSLGGIATPTAICSIDFPTQTGVEYTINSLHFIGFNELDGAGMYICNTSSAFMVCNVWSDPEGFMALPLKFGPSFSTLGSSIVQEITGSMTGTGVSQSFPDVEQEFNVPYPLCCFGEIWQIASTSAQYPQLNAVITDTSDIMNGNVTVKLTAPSGTTGDLTLDLYGQQYASIYILLDAGLATGSQNLKLSFDGVPPDIYPTANGTWVATLP